MLSIADHFTEAFHAEHREVRDLLRLAMPGDLEEIGAEQAARGIELALAPPGRRRPAEPVGVVHRILLGAPA